MTDREEVLVSAVPLKLRIERNMGGGLRIVVEGFDPIRVSASERIILRPEGHVLPGSAHRSPPGGKLAEIGNSRKRHCLAPFRGNMLAILPST